ncbi:DNA/RNA helicase domain-containing protein [Paenibacillus sp. FSL R5-0473]
MRLAKQTDIKRTIIVQGGPGTGKSVISMNALGGLLKKVEY